MFRRNSTKGIARASIFLLLLLVEALVVDGLQNLVPKNLFGSFSGIGNNDGRVSPSTIASLENDLIQTIRELGGENRLSTNNRIQELVAELEQTPSIAQPAISPSVYGRWRLLHTDNANTASPIQRKAVSSSAFPIYQDIIVNDAGQLIVSQVVKFSETNELKVDALASTVAYPLPELTERKGDGKVLGLNILGVSFVGEEAVEDENRPDSRIDFVFDEGRFEFGSDFSIPYPVPFRLPILRDAVKGWIDITYLSDKVRISRGNKGTTFILLKEE
mmetsp:Transcript_19281/g.44676  ORF Transcript_19281/g.44676 Transcript_19281/m.44676 type:complete len:275 (-) Transcript_19281:150-974(-)|eukprot:CAMPEP_0172396936 /NCGR_PEP_ID=MMETSP1061-20121228/27917_1 /TAXON_ID=37318 /ORGANISM="Pseudo-nitzschia pungens, Strain cf. pungens" /LENGTH=274 /DNA_ID=CAMNT_0013128937 /DNA_START=41 /DNA_END=865 /DNA_ORIENTATION=+